MLRQWVLPIVGSSLLGIAMGALFWLAWTYGPLIAG